MSQPHRAQHRQSEGDYYAETEQKLQQGTQNLGTEDRRDAQSGVGAQTQQAAAEYSVSQGQQLLEGQTARGDAPAPGQNYAANTHEELHGMANNELDLEGINARSRVTNVYGNWLADASNQFRDAATAAGASWQGAAASQANSFFQSTASHTEQTGSAMQLVSNHYSQQSAAAHYAKTNMPEPTGFNQQAELDKAAKQYVSGDLGGMATTMTGIQAKQQQADASHAQAVQVMQNLDSTYHGTATSQPTYTPPPTPGSDNTSVSGFHGGSAYGGGGGYAGGPGGAGGGSYVAPGGTPSPIAPGPQPPPSGYVPPGVSSGAGNFVNNPGVRPPVVPPTMPRADGLALSGGPAGTAGGTSGGDTTRGRTGAGRPGSGFAGSRVSGGGFTSKTPEGEGKASGAGKPAGERLERGATAAANAKGKAGAAGAGGAGAGKKKEEDKEHKNKVPIQEEVFEMRAERGPDGEKITPPVIGG